MTITQSCTATDCGRPTSLYLCNQCTQDLQAWIDKVPDLYRDLYLTMAKLDKVTRSNKGGKGGKAITGSPAPINLDAGQIRWNLATINKTAHQYAKDQDGAWAMTQIIDWCQKAEHLILGKPERRIIGTCPCGGKVITDKPKVLPTEKDPQPVDSGQCQACDGVVSFTQSDTEARINRTVAAEEPTPMTSTEVRAWIKAQAAIIISADDIKNWSKAKKIRQEPAANAKDKPRYWVSDVLRTHLANVESNRRKPKHARPKGVAK